MSVWGMVNYVMAYIVIHHAQPEDTNKLLQKLLENLQTINEELAEYISSLSWNHPTFYNDDKEHSIQYKEYLENSSNAITAVLPTKEPEYSLSIGEYKVTFNDESECDVPVKDESSPIFTTFSNPLFDCNDDFTSSNDESLSEEDVPNKNFKVYSNPLFDDEEINSDKIDPHYFNAESDLIESLSNRNTLFDSSPKFDYPEEFSGELMPTSIINEEHDLIPPGSENGDYNSEGDIHIFKELISNDTPPILENESSNFDHHDDPSFPRPPLEPPDVEILFEPDSGVLTTNVVKGIFEHSVLMPNILPTLPTFDPLYPVLKTRLTESDLIESLLNQDSSIISSSNIDSLLDEFVDELIFLKSIPPGINEADCDLEEEIRLIKKLLYDNSSPRPPKEINFENFDAIIESFSPSPITNEDRDILFLEELLSNDSFSLPENESFNFDIPSSPRPPAKPPDDDEIKPDTGILSAKVPSIFPTQPTLVSNEENSPHLLSHRGFKAFQLISDSLRMIYGGDIPILDVPFIYFYPP
nr:hypothetical protein [Tanacetum cinerariifolium]